MTYQLRVYGTPIPQGSKKAFYNKKLGRAMVVEANDKTMDWRQKIVSQAVESLAGKDRIEEAVRLHVTFYLPRPKTLPKRVLLPTKKPDVDKLLRAVCDALTDAGVWRDDSQVVELDVRKRYETGMHLPGALILVREVNE